MITAEQEFVEGKCVLKNIDDMDIFQLANLKSEPADVAKPAPKSEKSSAPKKPGGLKMARGPPMVKAATQEKDKHETKGKKRTADSSESREESPIDFDKIKKDMAKKSKKSKR